MAVTLDTSGNAVRSAAETVRNGGTVIYPTETCYGVGCDATDEEAVEKIYEIKQRPREKKLTVIVSDLEMAERYCKLTPDEIKLVNAFMPGPLTLLAEKKENVPDLLNDMFAFRIPGNETARKLVEEAGVPVVATSANVSGMGGKYRVKDIEESVIDAVDVVIDGCKLEETPSSTILKVGPEGPEILREGPIGVEEIESCLGRSR